MGDINEIIKTKLNQYPKGVALLAMKAIEISESSKPESMIAQELGIEVRKIIRDREKK